MPQADGTPGIEFDPKRDLPKVGPSGAKVVQCELKCDSNDQPIYLAFPPRPPERERECYDACGEYLGVYRLTDEQYAEEYAAYERAKAAWDRGGGTGFVGYSAGVPTIEVRIKCADGSTARGLWSVPDGTWKWVHRTDVVQP